MRCVCLFLEMTGLMRFVGASFGTQQRLNVGVEKAMVAYTREETQRLAQGMPSKAITVAQDATFTGGLCLVAIKPVRNYLLLEHTAEARDQDTWNRLMVDALTPLKCHVLQSTSDEASGLLAYVEHHLGVPHSPDLFHIQHEPSKVVSVPLAAKQRAAAGVLCHARASDSLVLSGASRGDQDDPGRRTATGACGAYPHTPVGSGRGRECVESLRARLAEAAGSQACRRLPTLQL